MPRAKPSSVVVHRIELGQKERDALASWEQANQTDTIIKSGAAAVAGAGIFIICYAGYWTLDKMFDWIEDAKNAFVDTGNAIVDNTVRNPGIGLVDWLNPSKKNSIPGRLKRFLGF